MLPNPVLESIHSHRSIRKYLSKPIEPEKLDRVLDAAVRASSSGNMQAYSIIVTKDQGLRQELLNPHFGQEMVTEAPVLLTFCADFHRMRRWLKLKDADDNFDNFMSFMIAAIDATLAAQTAAIAAEAEGLGLCYMGTTLASCDQIARILKCPENVVPVVGYSLGYAAESPPMRDRLPTNALVHRETYRALEDDDILSAYAARETAGWDRYMSSPDLRRLIEESGVENLAQVYTKVKYTRESHLHYSKTVLDELKARSFFETE